MSVRIMSWVFEESRTTAGERLVALALADNADDYGRCWPSVDRIAHKARVSRATVKRATQHMRALGELEVTDRGRHSNLYRFTCGLKLTPQDEREAEVVGSNLELGTDLVGSNPDVVGSNENGCGLTGEPLNHQEPSENQKEDLMGFDEFWEQYPKPRHKPDAVKAWRQVGAARFLVPILDGLRRWLTSPQWTEGRVEDASTFLRQRQWEDPVPHAARQGAGPGRRPVPDVAATKRLLERL